VVVTASHFSRSLFLTIAVVQEGSYVWGTFGGRFTFNLFTCSSVHWISYNSVSAITYGLQKLLPSVTRCDDPDPSFVVNLPNPRDGTQILG
jgi:hypothetical protein